MQQVFLNIVQNARQAIGPFRPSGTIQVTTEKLPAHVRITLQDDGPGIREENLSKIFDPFFTTKPVGQGTGLGLSLVYGIIHEHGGSISVRSQVGAGTAFLIELPIPPGDPASAAPEAPPLSPARPALATAGRRILVVDDEESILKLIRSVLTADGHTVETAPDGATALARIAQTRFDVIVSDWKMPGLNGVQIYERLRANDAEAARRMVFMTGDVVSETFQQFLQAQGKECLPKPFSPQEFRAAIANVGPSRG